jgi:hypothetical protein
MRVVCPYTPAGLRPETAQALEGLGWAVDMVDVSGSDEAYADLVEALWAAGQDFLLIEHDMLPDKAMVDKMDICGRWWCANPYPVNHQAEMIVGHGFVRYRAELLAALPDAASRAGRYSGRYPARHWATHDSRLARVLTGEGFAPVHRHQPAIGHLHLV